MTLTYKLFHKKANVFIFCDSEFLNEIRIVWSVLICYNTKEKKESKYVIEGTGEETHVEW